MEQGASKIQKDNITFKIQDFREDDTLDWKRISIIMIDVDPHDGVQEVEMMEFLKEKGWSGIMLLDDIGPGWLKSKICGMPLKNPRSMLLKSVT